MGFFTRPELENRQFKQESGSTLTLSGETNFAGTLKSKGVEIDGSVTGATVGDVLKWDGNKIALDTDFSGSTVYNGASPSNIEVGGMPSGSVLTGRTYTSILQEILITTYYPTLTAPSSTFIDNQANTQEVGTVVNINFTSTFNRGAINPQYTASSQYRSGLPNTYNYTGSGLPSTVSSTSLTDFQSTAHTLTAGANQWTNSVDYDAGVQPKDSDGNDYDSPLGAGTTSTDTLTITGIYPWFYGSSATPPVANQALISGGTKVVSSSSANIVTSTMNFTDEYLWFATPAASTTKTVWEGSNTPSNTGNIGDPSDLLASPSTVSIDSPTGLWSGVNYKIYLGNYPTSASYYFTFKNS